MTIIMHVFSRGSYRRDGMIGPRYQARGFLRDEKFGDCDSCSKNAIRAGGSDPIIFEVYAQAPYMKLGLLGSSKTLQIIT